MGEAGIDIICVTHDAFHIKDSISQVIHECLENECKLNGNVKQKGRKCSVKCKSQ